MKSPIISGLIAGFIAGLVLAISNISGVYELFSVLPSIFPDGLHYLIPSKIIVITIWGIVWGLLYSIFYDYLPYQGLKKGIFYGFILWVFVIIYPEVMSIMYGYHQYSIPNITTNFVSIVIAYGLLIGYLYKK